MAQMLTLFTLETPDVHLTWSRKQAATPSTLLGAEGGVSIPLGLRVEAAAAGVKPVVTFGADVASALFEQTDYVLLARSRAGRAVRIVHRDPVLLGGLHHAGDVVHGVVNLGAQIGRTRFEIELDGEPHLVFEVEVAPAKLGYRDDYSVLRADLEALSRDLVLAYLRSTYRPGRTQPEEPGGALGWALRLRHVADDLERALGQIAAHPLPDVTTSVQLTRADTIRRPDTAVRRAIVRGAGRGPLRAGAAVSVRTALLHRRAQLTLDTPEHRWLAGRVGSAARSLALLRREEGERSGVRAARVQDELADLAARLAALLETPPLAAAGAAPGEPSVRLLTAPGYREAYAACLALEHGLALEGGGIGLGVEDLHLLYEYWCFLTLVRATAAVADVDVPVQRLIAVEGSGLRYRLQRGQAHAVPFALPDGGTVRLVYNPRFAGQHVLVPQRPDIVLDHRRADGTEARYVLDAKYRLDASPGYVRRYGVPGPPTDALGTLHRYRDAITDRSGRRTVVQAVALYPWREAAPGTFAASRHGRALAALGVGAIPLLPGATHHLEAWLRRVLDLEAGA